MSEEIKNKSEFNTPETQGLSKEMIELWVKRNSNITVEGLENIESTGSMIMAANHESSLDPFLLRIILSASGRHDLEVLTKKESVKGKEDGIILTDEKWLENCISATDQGKIVLIFPEGAVTDKRRAHSGVVVLAEKTNKPIIPVHIEGSSLFGTAEENLSNLFANNNLPEKIDISVKFGKPESYSDPQELLNKIYGI